MQKRVSWSVFDVQVLEERDGFISFIVHGNKARLFLQESGSHTWQRVSPTEKRGRVHTSLITVAVLHIPEKQEVVLNEKDLIITNYCSSGNGGQNVQKNRTAVRILHKPSGVVATCQNERSQLQNKMFALSAIMAKLKEFEESKTQKTTHGSRYEQIGFGNRGNKIRTIRVKDNIVCCHLTNQTKSLKDYLKGNIFFKN
jgi:peptide chain release factor 1